MIAAIKKPKITSLRWKKKACAARGPYAEYDGHDNLVFLGTWYDVYRCFMHMYMDTPKSQVRSTIKPIREGDEWLPYDYVHAWERAD